MQKAPGKLIMAANSIGIPDDIPKRSLEALNSSDLLVFEEDRGARAALKAAGLHRDYLKFSEHGQQSTLETVRQNLDQGKTVLYMSDQGCPGLADPGRDLVKVANAAAATVTPLPGPSALTAAIAVCPFDLREFHFGGFPPREPQKRLDQLQRWKRYGVPLVLMDTPYRLTALIDACQMVFGAEHRGTLTLDISGERESVITGSLAELARNCQSVEKLNFMLILERSEITSGIETSSSRPASPRKLGVSEKPARQSSLRSPRNRRRSR